jgi:hypothetical protein
MLVTIKKTTETTEQVELKTPCYYKMRGHWYCFINVEGAILQVTDEVIISYSKDSSHYDEKIAEIIAGEPISEIAFFEKWQKVSEQLMALVPHS